AGTTSPTASTKSSPALRTIRAPSPCPHHTTSCGERIKRSFKAILSTGYMRETLEDRKRPESRARHLPHPVLDDARRPAVLAMPNRGQKAALPMYGRRQGVCDVDPGGEAVPRGMRLRSARCIG